MMTPDVAKRWIAAIRSDGAHPFHAGDTVATREMEGLYAQAYPEEIDAALGGALTGAPQNFGGDPMSLYNPARGAIVGKEASRRTWVGDLMRGSDGRAEEGRARARKEAAARRANEANKAAIVRERVTRYDRDVEDLRRLGEGLGSNQARFFAKRSWGGKVTREGVEMDPETGIPRYAIRPIYKSPRRLFNDGDPLADVRAQLIAEGKMTEKNQTIMKVTGAIANVSRDAAEANRQRLLARDRNNNIYSPDLHFWLDR
ncbi:MAG: hypothetical protein HQ495_14880 [Alphaproteobacteria bacterium]|nr:hypothetical protein [Alphaproteobacteria bacterium]